MRDCILLFSPSPSSSYFFLIFSVFIFLSSLFQFFVVSSLLLSLRASFEKVKDDNGWLADREEFELQVIKLKVGLSRRLFSLKYDVPPKGAQVIRTRIVDGVK